MNVKEKGVDDSENNVIALWSKGAPAGRTPMDGHIWPLTLQQAILPAFRLCRQRLDAAGRKTSICQPAGKRDPYVVLFWPGQHSMTGINIGLQFTYGGEGRFAFDVSAARKDATYRHQTSFYQECFLRDDPDFEAKVLMMSAIGVGLSLAAEVSPAARAVWTSTRLETLRRR